MGEVRPGPDLGDQVYLTMKAQRVPSQEMYDKAVDHASKALDYLAEAISTEDPHDDVIAWTYVTTVFAHMAAALRMACEEGEYISPGMAV
jgi:hypothetical protein